jgi:alpha-mannosidase/mannosylglycerate hydrolase
MSTRRVHYVLSTHWDREWYQTFQDYRYRLVKLLDRILLGWQEGQLQGPFQTDGQAIILQDYFEVRPQKRAEVEALAKSGKLVMGPWYVMPDEFLVSGESLIRNLRKGSELARRYGGKPSRAGFICDIFGHNSQMPQLFAGFGIKATFLWRGTNQIDKRLFRWRGADGTEAVCYRFGHVGYCDYAFKVRHGDQPHRPFDKAEAAKDLWAFIEQEAQATDTDSILVFDGGDHLEWNPDHYGVYAEASQQDRQDYALVHTSLDAFVEEILPQSGRIQSIIEGELRETGRLAWERDQSWLIPGVLSSRVWIKQSNAACESLLCLRAEPLSLFANGALHLEYPHRLLDIAWTWLLENHPHDSICGSSIDQVHEDMKYRFSQCRQIGDRVSLEAMQSIAASVEAPLTEDELRLVVFNPLARPFNSVVELDLAIPEGWPSFNEFFGFEPKPAFRLFDAATGAEVAYQRLGQKAAQNKFRFYPRHFPQGYKTDDVRVAMNVQIPALGYSTYVIRKAQDKAPTRHPQRPSLATSVGCLENEYIKVQAQSNGTLTLTDKRNGQIYDRLLTFEDIADIGDGWFHGIAVNDQAFYSLASPSQIALTQDGPFTSALRIRTVMELPQKFEFDSMARSEHFAPLVVDSIVTLRKDADYIDVCTVIDNQIDDHRVRVLFPSGVQAQTYLCDTPFDVVERAIAIDPQNHTYRELEVETRPQQSWTAAFDEQRGLAVVSSGLLESTVCDLQDRPIALTLYRSTKRTVFTNGEPLGQLRGRMEFRYRVVPIQGAPSRRTLCELGQELATGIANVQLNEADRKQFATDRYLPGQAGAFAVEGDVVVTSLRAVGDYAEMRLFNPNTHTVMATIHTEQRPAAWPRSSRVQYVDFESNPLTQPQALTEGKLSVPVAAKKIITLRFLD